MKKLVIIPGGFHPFHAGHMALYNAAREAFPSADVFVAATDDTSGRPFPFKAKKFLAQQAGVPGNRFIRVKSPFRAEEITQMYDPDTTQLIFARSEKDSMKHPQAGGVKKDGSPAYLQPYKRNGLQPMNQHGYMVYLPTVQFGPGMTSATEIRAKWPEMTPEEKIHLVKTLYPSTAQKDAAAGKIVSMFDEVMGGTVEEGLGRALASAALAGALASSPVDSSAARPASAIVQPAKKSNATATPDDLKNPAVRRTRNALGRAQKPWAVPAKESEMDEARLVNDPDAGHQIIPDGGMGTWDEKSMVSNLSRKFADMLNMLKSGDYDKLQYVLQKGQWVDSMITALAQYQKFMQQQGRRPIARGREIDLAKSGVAEDYVEEKSQP